MTARVTIRNPFTLPGKAAREPGPVESVEVIDSRRPYPGCRA